MRNPIVTAIMEKHLFVVQCNVAAASPHHHAISTAAAIGDF